MICAAFSIKTSFSRTNTFEIHSISTSKSLIHLIIDDIKKYCIFGTIVPLLNVRPNWEKVTSQTRSWDGKLTLRNFFRKDVIVCFVRINAFHANVDVNDNKQLF